MAMPRAATPRAAMPRASMPCAAMPCTAMPRAAMPRAAMPLFFWPYVYYLSKYYELIDTLLQMLRGRATPNWGAARVRDDDVVGAVRRNAAVGRAALQYRSARGDALLPLPSRGLGAPLVEAVSSLSCRGRGRGRGRDIGRGRCRCRGRSRRRGRGSRMQTATIAKLV